MVSLNSSSNSMEGCHRVPNVVPHKYKCRSVSAVRDFPPGCGRPRPVVVVVEAAAVVGTAESSRVDEKSVDGDRHDFVNVELEGAKQPTGHETLDKGGRVDGLDAQNLVKETVMKKSFTPRRVSAVRDFPPFCGRNAPRLPQEEAPARVPSPKEQLRLDQESSCVEEKPVEEMVKTEIKGKEDLIHDRVAGDEVKPEFDRHATKETKEEAECGGSGENGVEVARFESKREIVTGIMAADTCPLRQVRRQIEKPESASKDQKEELAVHEPRPVVKKKKSIAKFHSRAKKKSLSPAENGREGTKQMVICDSKDNSEDDENVDDFRLVERPRNLEVALPPSHLSNNNVDEAVTRSKVRETLRLFHAVCRKLLQEEESKSKQSVGPRKRVDLKAALILKDKKRYINEGKIVGCVPGVEVGDEFQYRIEIHIIGLHRPIQAGIDYLVEGSKSIAISIVTSGGYDDDTDNSDELIYSGSGGNKTKTQGPEDQKLERGNLALKNSVDEKNPVRVIRGDTKASDSDGRGKTYIYDGLYVVDKYWAESGPQGNRVYKFRLVRLPGQPEIAWKVLKKSKKFQRDGICVNDISKGQEHLPICAVNTIDDEKPPPFNYVTKMIYPDWCRPIPPKGCDCVKRCSESGKCSCVAKNGGEIPYNHNGAIVEAKPLVYECGPTCKCPPSCYNRVTQKGITFQLEIFKTETRGWGVRSLDSIPSGSFICEYVGELLEEKEAEERTGNDEYLFDIGNQYNDGCLWDGLNTLMPDAHLSPHKEVIHSSFTIDAAQYGNVGRFINHSCTPNLYAQNVLFDHEDKRIPHITLFAAENISPLQELTYHYNYTIDQVFDSNGNIRRKDCYCGSSECTGRMY